MNNSQIEIYRIADGKTEISVQLDGETVWLNLNQIAELFQRDKSVISRHINGVFSDGELQRESTVAKFATVQIEGERKIERTIEYFNLDVIISVGYRVKSIRGTEFRIWANKVLREYLVKGFSINERRLSQQNEQLNELRKSVKMLGDVIRYKELTNDESIGLLKIISDYAYALDLMDQYDYQKLEITETSGKETYQLGYEEAKKQIDIARKAYGNTELFGREKDKSFRSSLAAIYQTFDGNKRIAAFLFLYFLNSNGILYDNFGKKRLADNALVALTLMIAVSKPEEKDVMIKVIVNLINKKN